MKTISIHQAEPKQNPHGVEVKALYNQPDAQVMHITLKHGEGLRPHKTPVDVFFYVLEGTPTIYIGEESLVAEKDMLIESPKEIVHYISNENQTLARVLVVKTPNPMQEKKNL
jgi:mannose-6-phosphate isomerase-like protein (cupin superfamily)